jgi:transposase
LEPRLAEAKEGKRSVFFVDAAHFVFAPFLGYLWSFVRLFVEAPSGRQRFSVLAAINAVTLEIVKCTTEKSVNAESMKDLLTLIYNLNLKTPITIVLDNARYQHCSTVREYAELLNIELLFLPPYSPNLNLIERLWKFVKRTCLYTKTYENFSAFCSAISDTINQAPTTYREKLKSLMTLNFQSFAEIKASGRLLTS